MLVACRLDSIMGSIHSRYLAWSRARGWLIAGRIGERGRGQIPKDVVVVCGLWLNEARLQVRGVGWRVGGLESAEFPAAQYRHTDADVDADVDADADADVGY